MARRNVAAGLLALLPVLMPANGQAQSRQPTAHEVAAIRDCAAKNRDDVDAGEQECLFKLVADPCSGPLGTKDDATVADCYNIEAVVWDRLLNENYKTLLGELDDQQTKQARAMQRAWIAYRDALCRFYDEKIQGSMSVTMHAACMARQAARQALLLDFFSRL